MELCARMLLAAPASPIVGPTKSDRSSDSAWKLCVRGTFLDPVDPDEDPDVMQARRRRSSDPGLHSERPSFFAVEEGYAKQLQEKMNGLGGTSVTEEFARLRCESTCAPSPMSARSRGSSAFSWPGQPEGEASPPLPHGFPSNGSLGHPALCRLPCKDAASCRSSCSFCHLPHEADHHRKTKMDKINRQTMCRIDRHVLIEAMLGIMQGRVDELGLGEEAARALEEWHEDVAAGPPAQDEAEECPAAKPWEVRRLLRFLKTLQLNDFYFLQGPLDVRAASNRLVDKLRDLRAVA